MKRKIMICTALVLLPVLAAVICDRAWMAGGRTAETEGAVPGIFLPVIEAQGYFEEIGAGGRSVDLEVTNRPDGQAGSAGEERFAGAEKMLDSEIAEAPEDSMAEINIAHDVRLTAYCSCEVCCGYWATVRPVDECGNQIVYTSTMARAVQGVTVAVDPEFIPHGSYVYVQDPLTGAWREYRATDTSPETNHVDIYFDDHAAALESGYGGWGTVYWTSEPVDPGTLA